MKIYVASSWRNEIQPSVVVALQAAGHDVYDFRNPEPGNTGFAWAQIDPGWEGWTPGAFREFMMHPTAVEGYRRDMTALVECDACVMVLPCGRSASLEAGFAAGRGKLAIGLLANGEPELMFAMCDYLALSIEEVIEVLAGHLRGPWMPVLDDYISRLDAARKHGKVLANGGVD